MLIRKYLLSLDLKFFMFRYLSHVVDMTWYNLRIHFYFFPDNQFYHYNLFNHPSFFPIKLFLSHINLSHVGCDSLFCSNHVYIFSINFYIGTYTKMYVYKWTHIKIPVVLLIKPYMKNIEKKINAI